MAKKGFLGDIHTNNPLANARSPFKKQDPTIPVRIAKPLYEKIRTIAFKKEKKRSDIASAIVSYGLPIYEKKNK